MRKPRVGVPWGFQPVKDLASSLLCCEFDPQPGTFYRLQRQINKGEKKKEPSGTLLYHLTPTFLLHTNLLPTKAMSVNKD